MAIFYALVFTFLEIFLLRKDKLFNIVYLGPIATMLVLVARGSVYNGMLALIVGSTMIYVIGRSIKLLGSWRLNG